MKYGALSVAIFLGITSLIVMFQNLLFNSTQFSFLFWTYRTTPATPMFIGIFLGVLITLAISIFMKSESRDWEE